MLDFSKVYDIKIPEGDVFEIRHKGRVIWSRTMEIYVSLGDSIAAGHAIDDNWEDRYGTGSQYGSNGNISTTIVPGSYTATIRDELISKHGADHVEAISFAKSGDKVDDLIAKLDHEVVRQAISKASVVTICIGANTVLEPAMSKLEDYINAGESELVSLEKIVRAKLDELDNDSHSLSYYALFNKLNSINPDARYIFTTIYNPYKYLWLDEGTDGFFKPVFDVIPQIDLLGWDVTQLIKGGILYTKPIYHLYDRVNGLCSWCERWVEGDGSFLGLNQILRNKIAEYQKTHPNFLLADAKALYDTIPDRVVSANKHYNDLVNVEFTRGYDTYQMDWDALWNHGGWVDGAAFWIGLATKYVSTSGVDLEGLASELVERTIVDVIVPNIDPHPEHYGHYALTRIFDDALTWASLPRYDITFHANNGTGEVKVQRVIGIGDQPAYVYLGGELFEPNAPGYHLDGWNTKADGSGTSYTNTQFIQLSSAINLYAQWSNLCTIRYRHTNETLIYGNDETGHMECYALTINGEEKPKLGRFDSNTVYTYRVPYGSTITVYCSDYHAGIQYNHKDCTIYYNDVAKASSEQTAWTFTLTENLDINFVWKVAGSLITFDAQSWWDCYITTM